MVMVNDIRKLMYLLSAVLLHSCVPKERRVDFDKTKMEISLCESGTIGKVKVYGKVIGVDGPMNKLSEVTAINKGMQKISLITYNVGYDSIIAIEKILPNYQYQINIPYLDNQSEIVFYTDSLNRIDSVENQYNCK